MEVGVSAGSNRKAGACKVNSQVCAQWDGHAQHPEMVLVILLDPGRNCLGVCTSELQEHSGMTGWDRRPGDSAGREFQAVLALSCEGSFLRNV